MSVFQVLVLALLQGVTELFPVSSLGHTVILPSLLHWNINQSDPTFLPFVVLLHVGTPTALVIYFWRDWFAIVRAVLASAIAGRLQGTADERLGWRLILATIPVGIVGTLFQKQVQGLFANPKAAAAFLIVTPMVVWTAPGRTGLRLGVGRLTRRTTSPASCRPMVSGLAAGRRRRF